ncbi:hypothetical protein BD770DRAFT_431884 [Pilaira anomala]|nr:hypothetical protein BD770DRAFT_431884 [Pilaira anomala]
MMFQQCNGFVKAMIKFCEFYFLASMLYLDGSCLLLFRPRLRAVRAVQSWVEGWIDGSHLGRCHLKGKYYDQRLIVATTLQQLVILFFDEYVLSWSCIEAVDFNSTIYGYVSADYQCSTSFNLIEFM